MSNNNITAIKAHAIKDLVHAKCIRAGQAGAYQDSFYDYTVSSALQASVVREYCMSILRPSKVRKDMVHPFENEMIEFVEISRVGDLVTYSYKTRSAYTG